MRAFLVTQAQKRYEVKTQLIITIVVVEILKIITAIPRE